MLTWNKKRILNQNLEDQKKHKIIKINQREKMFKEKEKKLYKKRKKYQIIEEREINEKSSSDFPQKSFDEELDSNDFPGVKPNKAKSGRKKQIE